MRSTQIIYWVSTTLFFLFEGLMPALTSHTNMARQGIAHLGYPDYFLPMLAVAKVTGALVLLLPFFKGRIKEWAYAGFTFNILAATVSHVMVDGLHPQSLFPLLVLTLLATSYFTYHQLQRNLDHGKSTLSLPLVSAPGR